MIHSPSSVELSILLLVCTLDGIVLPSIQAKCSGGLFEMGILINSHLDEKNDGNNYPTHHDALSRVQLA